MNTNEIKPAEIKTRDPYRMNWFWPTLIIGGGVMLLLKAFGIGEEFDAFRILGSILLVGLAVASLIRFHFFMFLVPLSLVVYLWRTQLGIADLNLKILLAATVLISIGLSLVFRKKTASCFRHFDHDHGNWGKSEEILNENEYVNIESNFGEYTKYIHADNLKKVRLSSSFASAKVYFDPCQISPEGLVIDLNVNFSGVVLVIPKNWRISSSVSIFAGEINDTSARMAPAEHTVRLVGNVNFAEVKIQEI